jgi:hypothetical protein
MNELVRSPNNPNNCNKPTVGAEGGMLTKCHGETHKLGWFGLSDFVRVISFIVRVMGYFYGY